MVGKPSPNREAEQELATEFYGDGRSVREIARKLGRSYGYVHKLLAEAGVEFRPRGTRPSK